MSSQYSLNVFQLAGVSIDLTDPPWWTVRVLEWLYMVRCLQEASGDLMEYKYRCRDALDKKPPKAIYDIFKDYVDRIEHEDIKNRR